MATRAGVVRVEEALKRLRDLGFVAPEIREERLKYIEACLADALIHFQSEAVSDGARKITSIEERTAVALEKIAATLTEHHNGSESTILSELERLARRR